MLICRGWDIYGETGNQVPSKSLKSQWNPWRLLQVTLILLHSFWSAIEPIEQAYVITECYLRFLEGCCDRVPRDRVPRRLSAKETECQVGLSAKRVPSRTECQGRLSAKRDWVPKETECQERLSAKKEKLSIKSDLSSKIVGQLQFLLK